MSEAEMVQIDWEPIGIRSSVQKGTGLLTAARQAGVKLAAYCGGGGTCGACKVILREGECTPLTAVERDRLSEKEIQSGMRLACQAKVCTSLKLNIPMTSLSSNQRLQLEGSGLADISADDAVIRTVDITIPEPTINDLRSDELRLRESLQAEGILNVTIAPALLHRLSDELRSCRWQIRAVLRGNCIAAVLPQETAVFGLAVDIGTTKIAAYLIDLEKRECIAKEGTMNPQIGYGEDVVSRIAFTQANADGRDTLQRVLIEALNELIKKLCSIAGCEAEQIADAVIVCNTAIHHFLLNLPVEQLGLYPFVPAVTASLSVSASDLDLNIAPGASVYIPKNIAGYVGADHVSMLIGSKSWQTGKNHVALDVGTNTEISLITRDGKMYCCSCASGPAFEGAHIGNGMRASSGAVERAAFIDGELRYKTIDDEPAVGICGSGILDLTAALKTAGAVKENGRFDPDFPKVTKFGKHLGYPVSDGIAVTRADINEIILAKSAIRTGLEILLDVAGMTDGDIELFTIAGAFGTYLDLDSAIEIGMFPDIPRERYEQVGNAAGSGAQRMLLSMRERALSEEIVTNIWYVELTTHPKFMDTFVGNMGLKRN